MKKNIGQRKMVILIILGVIIIFLAGYFILKNTRKGSEQTISPTGQVSQDEKNTLAAQEVHVKVPEKISLPLTINGTVKGNWFFEGSFPVYLINDKDEILSVGLAKTDDEWMTDATIPFHVTIPTFDYTGSGSILFKKDNPSDDPQHDRSYRIPVTVEEKK
jgi:hypothetical protein